MKATRRHCSVFFAILAPSINEHVYSHKAAQKKTKTAQKTAIYSLAYIYVKQVTSINVITYLLKF